MRELPDSLSGPPIALQKEGEGPVAGMVSEGGRFGCVQFALADQSWGMSGCTHFALAALRRQKALRIRVLVGFSYGRR